MKIWLDVYLNELERLIISFIILFWRVGVIICKEFFGVGYKGCWL